LIFVFALLLFAAELALGDEFRIISFVADCAAVLDLDDAAGRAVEEISVVADDDIRAVKINKKIFQPFDCVNVEMTGFVDSIVALTSRRWSMTTSLGWSVWPTCSAGWK